MNSKIYKPTEMMSKFTTQSINQCKPFKPKSNKEEGEVEEGIIIMRKVGSKAEIGKIVGTDSEYYLTEVDCRMDNIA